MENPEMLRFVLQPTCSCSRGDSLMLTMAYDGSGRHVSKTRFRKACISDKSADANSSDGVYAADWERELVTHYTGIGTEVRESFHNGTPSETKVVVNMPQGLGRYGVEDAEKPSSGNATFEWYLKNHLGSTMLVYGTGDGAGSVKAAYDYRAFGEQVTLSEPTEKVTENFTGKERDDETELNYFGARYLDPMLGLWTSVDPKRQFASPYLYAGNFVNPINGFDPDGLTWEYAQNTGRLTHINDETGERSFVAYGYAGHGSGFNNSKYQDVVKIGPLPVGKYTISSMIEKHPKGKYSNYMELKPDKGNEMYGRSAFLIHGRKTLDDFDASSGCMIFDIAERKQIATSGDNRLNVVSDALEDLQDGLGNVFVNPHEIEVEQE